MRKRVVLHVFFLRFVATALAGFPLLFFAHPLWSAESKPPQKATYAGTEVCKACHAAQVETFGKTLMGRIFLKSPRNDMEKQSCENCHGPGGAHVAAGGGKGVGGMISFRKDAGESTGAQNQSCLQCHERGLRVYWKGGPHESGDVSCTNCHKMMVKVSEKNQLVKETEIETCSQCHLQRRAQLMRSSHMPLREGKMTCSDCHNPHGTATEKQLKANSVNENCYSCHAEKRGPFLWEHAPVRENCANCHEAHGSNHNRLLKVAQPRLCNRCHVEQRHPTTPQTPTSRFVFARSCLNCHTQIHGSNHPAGVRFNR
jgi:DmsE family decaheme c-type cytochrome